MFEDIRDNFSPVSEERKTQLAHCARLILTHGANVGGYKKEFDALGLTKGDLPMK